MLLQAGKCRETQNHATGAKNIMFYAVGRRYDTDAKAQCFWCRNPSMKHLRYSAETDRKEGQMCTVCSKKCQQKALQGDAAETHNGVKKAISIQLPGGEINNARHHSIVIQLSFSVIRLNPGRSTEERRSAVAPNCLDCHCWMLSEEWVKNRSLTISVKILCVLP